MTVTNRPLPRVFLSYAWEDTPYKEWVRSLAWQLTNDGVQVRFDGWHARGKPIPDFMNSEVRAANKVVILCSPKYRDKVHLTEDGVQVTGDGWESALVTSSIFAGTMGREQVVPVLTRGSWKNSAPSFLIGFPYVDLSTATNFQVNYRLLLQRLHGCEDQPPPTGEPPSDLAPEPAPPLTGPPPVATVTPDPASTLSYGDAPALPRTPDHGQSIAAAALPEPVQEGVVFASTFLWGLTLIPWMKFAEIAKPSGTWIETVFWLVLKWLGLTVAATFLALAAPLPLVAAGTSEEESGTRQGGSGPDLKALLETPGLYAFAQLGVACIALIGTMFLAFFGFFGVADSKTEGGTATRLLENGLYWAAAGWIAGVLGLVTAIINSRRKPKVVVLTFGWTIAFLLGWLVGHTLAVHLPADEFEHLVPTNIALGMGCGILVTGAAGFLLTIWGMRRLGTDREVDTP